MVPPKFIKSEAISSKMAIEKKATSTTFANPNNKKLRPRIPATDPKQIQNLWFQVRKQKFRNMTSIPKYLKPTEASARRSKDPNATASSSSVTPSGVGSTPPTSKSSTIAIKDPNFRELFLTPRGISIDDVTCTTSDPFIHFHTVRPSSYKGLEGLGRTTLWLDAEPTFLEEVTKGYFFMNYHNFCEAEYASFAKENLLKREPWEFILDNNKDSSQRFPRAERMLEFVCKPNGFFWQAPPPPPHLPVNSSENRTYSFDIRPDCSYWISRHAFNSKYSGQMGALVHVSQARITCPYFTVEFKRDDVDDRVAKNQVAAFGALALYNRYLLRYAAFPQNWTHEQECQLRHYALTITKSSYTFWCIRPKLKGRVWTGCHMEKIFVGYLDELQGVTDFVSWINEIHRWGLTNYLASCGKDIRLRAEAQGHRTSLDVQEMECTCLHLPDAAGTSEQETRNPTQALAGTSKIQGPALNNGAASVDPAKTAAEIPSTQNTPQTTPPQPITEQKKVNHKTRLACKMTSLPTVQEAEHSVEHSGPLRSVDADGVAKSNSQTPVDQQTGDKDDAVDDGPAADDRDKLLEDEIEALGEIPMDAYLLLVKGADGQTKSQAMKLTLPYATWCKMIGVEEGVQMRYRSEPEGHQTTIVNDESSYKKMIMTARVAFRLYVQVENG